MLQWFGPQRMISSNKLPAFVILLASKTHNSSLVFFQFRKFSYRMKGVLVVQAGSTSHENVKKAEEEPDCIFFLLHVIHNCYHRLLPPFLFCSISLSLKNPSGHSLNALEIRFLYLFCLFLFVLFHLRRFGKVNNENSFNSNKYIA